MNYPFLIPLCNNSKKAIIKDWPNRASNDPEVIANWAKTTQSFGVLTGSKNGFIVFDYDCDDYDAAIEDLKKWGLDVNTYIVQTKRGYHFYYKTSLILRNTVRLFGDVWDTRAENGYVVSAGSLVDGIRYKKLNGSLDTLPSLSNYVLDLFKNQSLLKTSIIVGSTQKEVRGYSSIVSGFRHNIFVSMAGILRRYRLIPEAMFEILSTVNNNHTTPPLSNSHLDSIVRSMNNYDNPSDMPLVPHIPDMSKLLADSLKELKDIRSVKGLPTGVGSLDELLGGGKRLGEITVTHAKAKTGKNTLWHWLMLKWLKRGIPIGYASREMSATKEVIPHMASIAAGVNLFSEDFNKEKFDKALSTIKSYPLYFADGYGTFPWEELRAWIIYLKEEKSVQYFWIDHLHYCLKSSENYQELSEYIRELKSLTVDLNIHIDLVIQPTKLGRNNKGEEYDVYSDSLRGGAALKQAVDNIFLLKRKGNNVLSIELAAARSKLASLGEFELIYDPVSMSFKSQAFNINSIDNFNFVK